jgi:phasin family protein
VRIIHERSFTTRSNGQPEEEKKMAHDPQSYIDMFRNFAGGLGVPKLDVDKLIETQRKNIDALGQSAKAAAGGAQSVAQKQREVLEASLREASTLMRGFQPLGNPQETLSAQTEFARKVFEIAVHGAQETAEMTGKSTTEVVGIIRDRLKESWDEIRDSVRRPGD